MTELREYGKTACDNERLEGLKQRYGKGLFDGFYSHEILELILSYSVRATDVKSLSKALLQRFKGLRGIFDASHEELTSVDGMTENAVIFVRLLKEAAGAYMLDRMTGRDISRETGPLIDYLNMMLSGERIEKFLGIYLDQAGAVLAVETLYEGTINQTVVYPRKAIEKAFKHGAHSIIFVHNHPSGDVTPSQVDRELTEALVRAARAVTLDVIDHIIIGRDRHFSAKADGWLGD